MPLRKHWRPLLATLVLFALNAYVCRELFGIGFMRNLDSNEGTFVSISRMFREHLTDLRWFPYYNCGMPIENAYQPLLPVLAAATGWISGWSLERAFHFVLAMAYCLGPVTLFWFAWEWSESLALGLSAGLAYSLTSFAELLIPVLRVDAGGRWAPLRLFNLIHYAEDPHNVALTILPLAFLFLRRAIAKPSAANRAGAVLCCAAVVLTNAFGAVDLAVGGLCIVLALRRGWLTLALTGAAAYLWMCPWLPPSLIHLISKDQFSARAYFSGSLQTYAANFTVFAVFVALWWVTRRLRPFERFSALFAPWMCIFPLAFFLLDVSLVPQGNRYQLELEMALCLGFGCLVARLLSAEARWLRLGLVAVLLLCGARQAKNFRHYARRLIQPVEITQTIQYKTTRWLDRNLPGGRAMISGDVEFIYNIFSNNPQLGGGHEPQVPNWMDRVAVGTIYTGINAGARDTEYSVFWLKAYGVQAITVPGPHSREAWHPVRNPHKFDGVLPVLWHDEDDTIFGVPQRSTSLAHVIPREALVTRQPIHGLDIEPAQAYVAAIEDPALPEAPLTWTGNSGFTVSAPVRTGQILSIQVTWDPGWEATANGRPVPLRADALGLIAAEPRCDGPCEVRFHFGVTREAWLCRLASAAITLILLFLAARGVRSRRLIPLN